MKKISGSSVYPNFSLTTSCASFISVITSCAEARPPLTIKFACFPDILAPPTDLSLRPHSSIRYPVESFPPSTFFHAQPDDGRSKGCVSRLLVTDSVAIFQSSSLFPGRRQKTADNRI